MLNIQSVITEVKNHKFIYLNVVGVVILLASMVTTNGCKSTPFDIKVKADLLSLSKRVDALKEHQCNPTDKCSCLKSKVLGGWFKEKGGERYFYGTVKNGVLKYVYLYSPGERSSEDFIRMGVE